MVVSASIQPRLRTGPFVDRNRQRQQGGSAPPGAGDCSGSQIDKTRFGELGRDDHHREQESQGRQIDGAAKIVEGHLSAGEERNDCQQCDPGAIDLQPCDPAGAFPGELCIGDGNTPINRNMPTPNTLGDAFLGELDRTTTRTNSFLYLLTDEFPPFGGEEGPNYPVRIGVPAPLDQYSRLKTGLRLIIGIPVMLLAIVQAIILYVVAIIAWFAYNTPIRPVHFAGFVLLITGMYLLGH